MALDRELLSLLRCPRSGGTLLYFETEDGLPGFGPGFLFCPESRLKYPIDELDIPVMLIEEAVAVDEAEAEALVARALARKED